MGNSQSTKAPTEKVYREIADKTRFKESEIPKFWEVYKNLGAEFNKGGYKDSDSFGTALGITNKHFSKLVFKAFDATNDKKVSFYEFVYGMSALSSRATIYEKSSFVFSIYDTNLDGYIDKNEFCEILMCCLYSETDEESACMASDTDQIFDSIDVNNDGLISLEEFVDAVKINPTYLTCVSDTITSSLDILN